MHCNIILWYPSVTVENLVASYAEYNPIMDRISEWQHNISGSVQWNELTRLATKVLVHITMK